MELENKDLSSEIESYKHAINKYEDKLEAADQNYQNNLAKAQKDIAKCLAVFNKNWADEIERVQQEV